MLDIGSVCPSGWAMVSVLAISVLGVVVSALFCPSSPTGGLLQLLIASEAVTLQAMLLYMHAVMGCLASFVRVLSLAML